jgi:hypothetical protein
MKLFIDDDGQVNPRKKDDIDFVPALRRLLLPYTPVGSLKEADRCFSTAEIVARIEEYFGISQSDPEKELIYGPDLVTEMHALGFIEANVSGQLQWLMKKI